MNIYWILFLVWKALDFIVSIIAPKFIPYLGFFSYRDDVLVYHVPDFIRALSNFDGIFYIRIALKGYSYTEQAYFPIYPILIHIVNFIVHNPIVSGVLISNIAFIIAYIVFRKYLSLLVKPQVALWAIIFLLAYPASYYFGVMYTESVFFVLLISTLYSLKKQRFFATFIFAYLTALTRFIGLFLFIPIGIVLLEKILKLKKFDLKKIIIKYWKYILVTVAPILGLATYSLYLWKTTGDPLFFFHTQENFGANRSSHLITPPQVIYRYLKIFLTADKNFQYFVSVLEFFFYIFVLSLLIYDLRKIFLNKKLNVDRLGLNIFSFVNVLIPSLTGTLTAVPRYCLVSISIFFVLAEIKNKPMKYAILTIFIILHITLFAFFVQGYYVT